jgi:hypothetical protein
MIAGNIGETIKDQEWLHGQIASLQKIIAKPIDRLREITATHEIIVVCNAHQNFLHLPPP